MSKREAPLKGEALKQQIMQVALRHFALKGFSATNMDEIAEEIGINKPSIYYHIGKKEQLFDTVIIKAIEDHQRQLEQSLSKTDKPEERLRAYVLAFAQNFSGENHYLANLILRQVATEGGYFPKQALETMVKVQQRLWGILQQGTEQGIFKAVNPFQIHMLIVGFFTTSATSGVMKQKFAEAVQDEQMPDLSIDLFEAADMIYEMLMATLKG